MKIAVIGGGAAGFFSAITAKGNYPDAEVVIFEKSGKLLSRVKVSAGGRCNLTNGCQTIKELAEAYPRGRKELKKAFKIFSNKDAMEWFESRAVPRASKRTFTLVLSKPMGEFSPKNSPRGNPNLWIAA